MTVRQNAAEKVALISAIIYIASPFFVVYEGISWLSEQPMVFFAILGVYLLGSNRLSYSAIAFGVAVLFKQDALFFAPAYLFWLFKRSNFLVALRSSLLAAGVFLCGSLPFLLVAPFAYFEFLTYGKITSAFVPPIHLPSTVPGAVSVGGFSVFSTNAFLPNLTCSDITRDIFGTSEICTGAYPNGFILTNWVSLSGPLGVERAFIAICLLLAGLAVAALYFLPAQLRFQYSFAVSVDAIIIPILQFSELGPYKYYLVPVFALILLCASNVPTMVIACLGAIFALLSPIWLITMLIPPVSLLLMIALVILSKRTPRLEGEKGSNPNPDFSSA